MQWGTCTQPGPLQTRWPEHGLTEKQTWLCPKEEFLDNQNTPKEKGVGLLIRRGAPRLAWGHLSGCLDTWLCLGWGWLGGLESEALPVAKVPGFLPCLLMTEVPFVGELTGSWADHTHDLNLIDVFRVILRIGLPWSSLPRASLPVQRGSMLGIQSKRVQRMTRNTH